MTSTFHIRGPDVEFKLCAMSELPCTARKFRDFILEKDLKA